MDLRKLGRCDLAVIGAGAAGLATAIMTRRDHPNIDVVLLDGSVKPGAKILVSGGGRCNVTNTVVVESDFWGGKHTMVRRVLQGFSVSETVRFFEELGLSLHEEAGGKLFPNSNRARDVLRALLEGTSRAGVRLETAARVTSLVTSDGEFVLETSRGTLQARSVVLATGGRSLPKTGSDGGGYALAQALGHTLVPQTPALAPLVLETGSAFSVHEQLSGVAVDAEISIWIDGAVDRRLTGALLWTHFGISGPVVLNASRHWARASIEQRAARLTLNLHPGSSFDSEEAAWIRAAADRPRTTLRSLLAARIPDAVAQAILRAHGLPPDRVLADLARDDRRRVVRALVEWPLPVVDTRGYNYAEVTAGGVDLREIDPGSMESRRTPGLFLVGEILDVDGRIGGFNFQWAWSSARAAARGVGRRLSPATASSRQSPP